MSDQTDLSLEDFEQENYNFEGLEVIASDDNKIKFLEVLSSSKQLIEWLKLETNGTYEIFMYCNNLVLADITELHNLVGLSMFEDNAQTMDRVAQLHTVGSAIAPLVYELDVKSGLIGFLQACEPVWKAIEVNPQLTDSFVSCFCV